MSERANQASEQDHLEPPAPAEGEAVETGISLSDLLRAIFTPDDIVERRAAPPPPQPIRDLQAEVEEAVAAQDDVSPEPEAPPEEAHADSPAAPDVPPIAAALGEPPVFRPGLAAGTLGALFLGYLAQRSLTVGQHDAQGVLLYALAAVLWLGMLVFQYGLPDDRWAWLPKRDVSPPSPDDPSTGEPSLLQRLLALEPRRLYLFAAGLALSALTYLTTANNRFTFVGLLVWLGSIGVWIAALSAESSPVPIPNRVRAWLRRPRLRLRLESFTFLVLLVVLVAAFYRFFQLDAVPPEMTSDHVEKLLDAYDVQRGRYSVFFPRNGGREAIQMYLVALAANLFGTGISFTSLKLVSALEGLALIPVVIALGKELMDRETGLLAALLLALSWWHVALSRMGLRIVLTPLVASFVLIYLLRGLRSNERRHFIAVGLWLGVGVYSYQAMRMMPLVVVAGAALALFTPGKDWAWRRRLLGHLAVAGLLALVIAVPMGRFWADSPDILWNRVVNRTTSSEVPIAGSPTLVFLQNLRDALLMFNWRGDAAWISAVPGEPLLGVVSGFLFILGLLAWGVRLAIRRDPVEGLVPVAIFIMLLPSALAIAFPIENPSATRGSGVIPFVYLLAAWPLRLIQQRLSALTGRPGRRLALVSIVVLSLIAALFNYQTFFHRYRDSYSRSGLNPSEVGEAVAGFADSIGSLDNAYLQGYPFWHDYRAIGIEAGDITWDNAILDAQHLVTLLAEDPQLTDGQAKLFVVHPDDEEARTILEEAYPEGQFVLKESAVPERDFYIFVVPAQPAVEANEALLEE